ncbi:MAG: cation-transporting P-type ATPase [Candidatus Omnitrophica bacterium]|nr:cation-transporting P-type ATPase [Candidatus Omnitrophota bacterium]
MYTIFGKHWHHMPQEEVLHVLGTDREKGLDLFEIQNRQEHFGPNVLKGKKGKSPLVRFLLQFHQPLIYILLGAAAVTAIFKAAVDAAVIFIVVLVNAIIGFVQEAKAVQAIEALAKTVTTQATVVRAGQKISVPSDEIVPGDVVLLQSGDKVPADLRLIEINNLQTDEASLTGESLPVQKNPEELPDNTLLANRTNMAFASSLVTYGQAKGIVVATAEKTEVGRISELLATTEELQTPLTRKIAQFSHLLLYWIMGLTVATFIIGLLRKQELVETFVAAVALAVAAIPEGLPAVVTITLAIGVHRMAKRGSLIRKLPAVETLGSTTVVCSDKTGTLTENQMTVTEVYSQNESIALTGTGYNPEGEARSADKKMEVSGHPNLQEIFLCGLLCNDSRLLSEDGQWKAQGDPTEVALIAAARKAGLSEEQVNASRPRLHTIPFESQHQYMAVLVEEKKSGKQTIYVKGAVEKLLERSKLDSKRREQILSAQNRMAQKGLRVLAFARKELSGSQAELSHGAIEQGLQFLGLQGMIDPPRKEAIDAVKVCHHAGIMVKMITGDHAITAQAIAEQLGLSGSSVPLRAISGADLEKMSDQELINNVEEISVFARVTPEQKLRIVEALQARKHVVAMTGDGVNDAPALKKADIGIAMGITGTEVAKEAADMILTDDNFSTIEKAIEEGRGVFDNLIKFISWILPTNLGQGLVILAAIIANVPLPILPVQILWINMTTALFLGLPLAFENKEPGLMNRMPRRPDESFLNGVLIFRLFVVGFLLLAGAFGIYELALLMGANLQEARTVSVGVFTFGQMFYLFNCRSFDLSMRAVGYFSNPWVWIGSGLMILFHVLFTYLRPMNALFHSHPMGLAGWLKCIAVGLVVFSVVGIEKKIRYNLRTNRKKA